MPNNIPPCLSSETLELKKRLIDKQLDEVGIPLRYHLYLGGDENNLDEIKKAKGSCIGLKIFMGCSTGNLSMESDQALEEAFRIASDTDTLVAVHAEDHGIMKANEIRYAGDTNPSVHSKIRDRSAAIAAVKKAILLAEKYHTRLYVLHVSTKEELDLIRDAKSKGINVYAEGTPHHLFLTESEYVQQGTKVQVNPPLRTQEDCAALWKGIEDGTIDSIGTDHAPHTLSEKQMPYPKSPAGIPGIETLLPLLLNANRERRLSLHQLVKLTRTNLEKIFRLETNQDIVLVDLNLKKTVNDAQLKTKCGWSPYNGMTLTGWPVYTILKGEIYGPL